MITTEDYKILEPLRGLMSDAVRLKTIVGLSVQRREVLAQMYEKYSGEKVNARSCGPCILRMCAYLHTLVQEYQSKPKKAAKRKK